MGYEEYGLVVSEDAVAEPADSKSYLSAKGLQEFARVAMAMDDRVNGSGSGEKKYALLSSDTHLYGPNKGKLSLQAYEGGVIKGVLSELYLGGSNELHACLPRNAANLIVQLQREAFKLGGRRLMGTVGMSNIAYSGIEKESLRYLVAPTTSNTAVTPQIAYGWLLAELLGHYGLKGRIMENKLKFNNKQWRRVDFGRIMRMPIPTQAGDVLRMTELSAASVSASRFDGEQLEYTDGTGMRLQAPIYDVLLTQQELNSQPLFVVEQFLTRVATQLSIDARHILGDEGVLDDFDLIPTLVGLVSKNVGLEPRILVKRHMNVSKGMGMIRFAITWRLVEEGDDDE